LPLVSTHLQVAEKIRKAYSDNDVELDDDGSVESREPVEAEVFHEAMRAIRGKSWGMAITSLLANTTVGTALLRLWSALDRGVPVERLVVAIGTVLASALITSPSSLVYYTSAYPRLYTDGYKFDAEQVAAQDSLVRDCLQALDQVPENQQTRRTGLHGHDAAFKREPTLPDSAPKWYQPLGVSRPLTVPVLLTLSNDSTVYTCGDRPDPLPTVGEHLYADDSLVWTHQSRFWAYPCWGKPRSAAAANEEGKKQNELCTRFVISMQRGARVQCYPMDMSQTFPNEVHVVEAPVHLGAYLDSLVLYDERGIVVTVTSVRDNIKGEVYTSEICCTLKSP
jgi:hypothetical protein